MGKLAIMSDLHVDINKLFEPEIKQLVSVLKNNQITHLHLAGDTANTIKRVLETVDVIESSGIPVTFNFGNHELPDISNPEKMEDYPDKRFLNLKTKALTTDTVLLGLNGWYDYSYSLESDYDKIVAAKNLFWYDRMIERHMSDPEVTTMILTRLKPILDHLKEEKKQVILATHFVPRKEFIHYHTGEYERWNQINAFLGSENTGALLDHYPNIQHVVFGHTHRQFNSTQINQTTYTAKPFGYFYEWHLTREFMLTNKLMAEFNPLKVRSLLRGHHPKFEAFKQMKLMTEYARKMTVIEY